MICMISIVNFALCGILILEVQRQNRKMQYLVEQGHLILTHINFTSDANEAILWKIRQEIFTWQNQWAASEQYEAAQQAKIMLSNIEYLIENYRKNIKTND